LNRRKNKLCRKKWNIRCIYCTDEGKDAQLLSIQINSASDLIKRMEHIEIRKAVPDDVYKLQEIGRATFYETFSPFNTEENIKEYLCHSFATEKLKKELSDANSGFYFAYNGKTLTGYLKVNWGSSQTEIKDANALEIERIYVLKEYQGRKVGQHLYEKAIEIAGERGVDFVWLGVWERNHKALRFYLKNGFTEFDRHVFRLGKESQTDLMMKLDPGKQKKTHEKIF